MNKTDDIEWAIGQALLDGPLTLDQLEDRLPMSLRERNGFMISNTILAMLGDGRIRAVGCDHGGNHDGSCDVEAVR